MSSRRESYESAGASGAIRPASVSRPLSEVAGLAGWLAPVPRVSVTGITLDSRSVMPGDLYCALPGAHVHGARFAADAVRAGCHVILTDAAGAAMVRQEVGEFPMLLVTEPRAVVGPLSSWAYGHPSERMKVVGITGTDGKTTTAMLAEAGLQTAGRSTGLIGTVTTRIDDQELPSVRTTPEAPDLHALLAVMFERGVDVVVMEVSSHAIALGRVSGIDFDVAVFTNLGHDHLDFHGTQEDYFAVKARLFSPEFARAGLINIDDRWGRRLTQLSEVPYDTFSVEGSGGSRAEGAPGDWHANNLVIDEVGWQFDVSSPAGTHQTGCRLPGVFNVHNALAAIAICCLVGADLALACSGVQACTGVPGRMQVVEGATSLAVLVDYAHTPDAVERALAVGVELAKHRGGRLITVLGCGGDRDRAKRAVMGITAARLADVAVITDDNPRSEVPADIRHEMMRGVQRVPEVTRAQVSEVADREAALRFAIDVAEAQDVVFVLGKGHETYQEVAGRFLPFDDRTMVAAIRSELGK